MESMHEIPGAAVRAFERASGLVIAFHDLTGQLPGFLPPEKFGHSMPPCLAVKADHMDACIRCDADFTRSSMAATPTGRVQICHAGLVEWTVPCYRQDRLDWVMFAGQRRPAKNLTVALKAPTRPNTFHKLSPVRALKEVGDDEALHLLELTRMLGVRLKQWRAEYEYAPRPPVHPEGMKASAARATAIRHFIANRHTQRIRLEDLAEYLHISESRAGHAVREACGQSFVELLVETRLKTATELLRYTNLSVLDIATRSGFNDLSHFHETFRDRTKATPHRFRKREQAKLAPGGSKTPV